jgi:general stress protein 26
LTPDHHEKGASAMSDITNNPAEVEHRLWDHIEKDSVGMLMLVGGAAEHAQPMHAFLERNDRRIWFFVRADSEFARHVGAGREAMFIYQRNDFQACVGGQIYIQRDKARIDKYWNAVIAAWSPGGKDDSNLTMLCMDCDDAQVWLSEAGPVKFMWEIAKANATHRTPDVGGHAHLNFH